MDKDGKLTGVLKPRSIHTIGRTFEIRPPGDAKGVPVFKPTLFPTLFTEAGTYVMSETLTLRIAGEKEEVVVRTGELPIVIAAFEPPRGGKPRRADLLGKWYGDDNGPAQVFFTLMAMSEFSALPTRFVSDRPPEG